jgi:hypothetical protein
MTPPGAVESVDVVYRHDAGRFRPRERVCPDACLATGPAVLRPSALRPYRYLRDGRFGQAGDDFVAESAELGDVRLDYEQNVGDAGLL